MGTVIVADEQTAGRGRLARTWETPPGSGLAVSLVVQPRRLLSLLVGVAAAEACGHEVRLKWPNDLLLDGRKVGGILVEAKPGRAVVGLGINLKWAPPGAAFVEVDRDELLTRLLKRVEAWLRASDDEVLERWRQLADTLGARVTVSLPGRVIEGVADDIDADGSLVVAGERVSAGDVIHVSLRKRAEGGPRRTGHG